MCEVILDPKNLLQNSKFQHLSRIEQVIKIPNAAQCVCARNMLRRFPVHCRCDVFYIKYQNYLHRTVGYFGIMFVKCSSAFHLTGVFEFTHCLECACMRVPRFYSRHWNKVGNHSARPSLSSKPTLLSIVIPVKATAARRSQTVYLLLWSALLWPASDSIELSPKTSMLRCQLPNCLWKGNYPFSWLFR